MSKRIFSFRINCVKAFDIRRIDISSFGKSLYSSVRQFDSQQWSPVTRLLACLGLNVNVSVSMTARCNRWRSDGPSTTTVTSPTLIYLDRDKSSRTNTSNCPSRLTKKRSYLPPPRPEGGKWKAPLSSDGARSIAIDNRKVYPRCPFTTNFLACTRGWMYLHLHHHASIFSIFTDFTVTLACGPGSTWRWSSSGKSRLIRGLRGSWS